MKPISSLLSLFVLCITAINANAQDNSVFNISLANNEYEINMVINLYDQNILVDGQEFLGEVAGYISTDYDYRVWIIVGAEIIDANKALLTISNDYGSEDLRAVLLYCTDGSYILKQTEGSSIKFGKDKKWIKIPKELKLFPAKDLE